jgi:uncharacterized protein YoxC
MILLLIGYQNIAKAGEIFDSVIPNGVLITQSEDDIQMTKHLWRAYIVIPQPTRPVGLKHNVKVISEYIDKIYKKSYFTANEMQTKKAKLIETVSMFQKLEFDAKYIKRPRNGEPRLMKKLVALNFDDGDKNKTFRQKRGLFNFIGDALHTLFGTATSEDVHRIEAMIKLTYESANKIKHSYNNLTSVVNRVQDDIFLNRETINSNVRNIDSLFDFAFMLNRTIFVMKWNIRKNAIARYIDNMIHELLHCAQDYQHVL